MNSLSLPVTSFAKRPKALLKRVKALGYTVKDREPGIYVVESALIPFQIVVTKQLGDHENLWLRNLGGHVNVERMREVLEASKQADRQQSLSAYLDVLLSANPETFEEAYGKMTGIEAVFERIGIAEKMRKEGMEVGFQDGVKTGIRTGIQTGARQIAKKMLDADMAPEQIMTLTQLTLEQIDALRKEPMQ